MINDGVFFYKIYKNVKIIMIQNSRIYNENISCKGVRGELLYESVQFFKF